MGQINGVVIEKFTNKPIEGAMINMEGFSSITNRGGQFSLYLEGSGIATVYATAEGYQSASMNINIGFPSNIKIVMEPIFGFL